MTSLVRAALKHPPLASMNLSGETGLSVQEEALRLSIELLMNLPNLPSHRLIRAVQSLSAPGVPPAAAFAVAKSAAQRFVGDLHAGWDAKRQLRLVSALSKFPAALSDPFWTLWAREISRSMNHLTPAELVTAATLLPQSTLPLGEIQLLQSEIARQFSNENCLLKNLSAEAICQITSSLS